MLNIKIIFLINTFLLFIFSVFFIIYFLKNPHNKIIKFITYFVSSYFLGFVLFIFRNQISDFFSIVIANTLFATGSLNLYLATRAIVNLKSKWEFRYCLPIFIIFMGHYIFTYIDFNIHMRVIIFNLFAMVYSFFSFLFFWKNSSIKYRIFDKISSIIFLIGSIMFFILSLYSYSINISAYYFSNTDFFLILPNLYILALNLWIISLIAYRIKN